MQPLVPLVFHNLPSLYPPSFRINDFLFIYTSEAEALSVAHARIVYLTREIRSVVYGRNAEYLPVSRIKMGDYRAHVNTGTLQLSSKRSHYTKNAKFILKRARY